MSLPYFYEPFTDAGSLSLNDDNLHYMLQVLRMRSGDACWITHGKGVKVRCTLTVTGKRSGYLTPGEVVEDRSEISGLHLAIAFTKNPSRIEWLLEKATEIGVGCITPLQTQRSEKLHWKKERFEKILVSAMLQSQQTRLPVLQEAQTLQDVLQGDETLRCIAWCDAHSEKRNLAQVLKKNTKTLLLIGPEGDFAADEVHLCLQHACMPVSLGPHRLRTETAGLYATVVYNAIQ